MTIKEQIFKSLLLQLKFNKFNVAVSLSLKEKLTFKKRKKAQT
jgi:hypothetical protein